MPQTEAQRRWYEANRERVVARVVARQTENHEAYLAYQRENRAKNLEAYRAKSRAWKAANAEQHRASSRAYGRAHATEISLKRKAARRTLKEIVLNAYGRACACCGEATFEFLTLDHANGDGAEHRRLLNAQTGRSHKVYRDLIDRGFPEGFRILCFNCNSVLGFYGYCPHQITTPEAAPLPTA